jgi:hypothetical protein
MPIPNMGHCGISKLPKVMPIMIGCLRTHLT